MKIKKQSKFTKKRSIILAVLLVTLVTAGGTYAYMEQQPTHSKENETEKTAEQESTDTSNSKTTDDAVPEQDAASASNSVKIPREEDTDPTNDQQNTTPITISSAQRAGDTVQVRTLISAITPEGTCSLTVVSGDKSYTDSAGVQALANASTCKGFNVPVNQLPRGNWLIKVEYKASTGVSTDTKEIQV